MADLPPELDSLSHDARQIWSDPRVRKDALEAVVRAWESGSGDLTAARRVDAAVVEALRAFGLPRGPIARLLVEAPVGPIGGQKRANCDLLIAPNVLKRHIDLLGMPDTGIRTWVHESIHARQAYVPGADRDYERTPGYEEGLTELLARLIVQDRAYLGPIELSYDYYVGAYTAVARVFDVDIEHLARELWKHPNGRVRAVFPDILHHALRQRGGFGFTNQQQRRLLVAGDAVFHLRHARDVPNPESLEGVWRTVLR